MQKIQGMKKMAMAKKMGMRKMAMKKSKIAKGKRSKVSVWHGTKEKTQGGLKKSDLKKNKHGRVVSRARSAASSKSKGAKVLAKWGAATKQARKQLGIKGFCPVGGKSAKGQALLKAVRSILKK